MVKTQKVASPEASKEAYGCPFCSFITKIPLEWKQHLLDVHGFHYTKWHESIPDAEPAPICNWSKINDE